MKAMLMHAAGEPLQYSDIPLPAPGRHQALIQVHSCGVCRTDLHIVDGDLTEPILPLVPGHEIIGVVIDTGSDVELVKIGDRIGVPWLGFTCGECRYCLSGRENLCDHAIFTGYQINGGYAEYTVADERYCFPIPTEYSAAEAAPLLCAGLIGYRSLMMAGDARRIGIYGFGAAAHIIAQVAVHQQREVFAFTRPGDTDGQQFALDLGVVWAGSSEESPPEDLDAAIIFAPIGWLVPAALRSLVKGGAVICAGIHMSEIPAFPYDILWGERSIKSVANLTRNDGVRFLELAPQIPVRTDIHRYQLEDANKALDDLRAGRFTGAAVLEISS